MAFLTGCHLRDSWAVSTTCVCQVGVFLLGSGRWQGCCPALHHAESLLCTVQAPPTARGCLWAMSSTQPPHVQLPQPCPFSLESFKIQYLQFLAYTKTPQYKANLQQLLDQEKVRVALATGLRDCSPMLVPMSPALLLQERNAQLLGTVQQLFGHCQTQKEEIRRLFQQKLDEVVARKLCWPPWDSLPPDLWHDPGSGQGTRPVGCSVFESPHLE